MRKKILMFGWEFPPFNSGGLGTACFGLTKALAKQKMEIMLVLPKKLSDNLSADFLKFIFPEDSHIVKEYNFNSLLTPYMGEESYSSSVFGFGEDFGGIYKNNIFGEVFRYADFGKFIAKKEEFDIIHAHDWLSFGAGINAKRISGKPFIAHVHATEFDRGGGVGINKTVYQIEKRGMEEADRVIAVSNFTKNIIVTHYGISADKVEVVHNGIEFVEEEGVERNMHKLKEAGKKIVLFVGRLTLQKGPDYFIRSAKKVCERTDDVYFIISGSGDMEYSLIREVARLGISDRVFFTGFLRGDALRKVYKISDLFVMPSVSEPFGITPLESLVNGTPVLISNQSGVSEVLSHALKVDFWDIDEMANKIISAIKYDSLGNCLKGCGKEEVKNITWDLAAKKCINLYNSA